MQRSTQIAFWSSAAMLGVVAGVVMLVYADSGFAIFSGMRGLPAEFVFALAGGSAAIASAMAMAQSPTLIAEDRLPEPGSAIAAALAERPGGSPADPTLDAAAFADSGVELDPGVSAPSVGEISMAVHQLVSEFEAAKESQRKLIRGIGHDLRSPLASIVSMSENLAYGEFGMLTQDQIEACNLMTDTARRLMAQSELLYGLAEGRGDVEARRRERFDAREVLRPIVEGVRVWAEAKGLELEVRMSEYPMQIISDRGAFERISANLIDNAVKFTDEGRVSVTLGSTVDYVRLVVEDSGIGIPAEEIEHIMTEYYRSERSSERDGMGVGLAVVRELAEALGGTLAVTSEMGKGSRFEVCLPVISEA